MKLTLRDLFWFTLVVSVFTIWTVGRRQVIQQIQTIERQSGWRFDLGRHPNSSEIWRRDKAKQLSRMSDQQLDGELSKALNPQQVYVYSDEYEACLAELERRGQIDRLEQLYHARNSHDPPNRFEAENLRVLTALRRTQGLPDPLRIEIAPSKSDRESSPNVNTFITARFANVDDGGETVTFETGGDYRGGRLEKWRLTLTDGWGQQVANSNFLSLNGGGLVGFERLTAGSTSKSRYSFDMRRYVAPPRSGKYRLQVFFHTSQDIADQQDLTGLIVAQSEPIPVTIANPNDRPPEWFSPKDWRILATLAVGGVLLAVSYIRRARSHAQPRLVAPTSFWRWPIKLVSRDACWFVLILAVALGFLWDQRTLEARLGRLTSDANAEWSIQFDRHWNDVDGTKEFRQLHAVGNSDK